MTDFNTLKTKLAECQAISAQMVSSGVWDEMISSVEEQIDNAVLLLDGTYALTDCERSVRARDWYQDSVEPVRMGESA